MISQNCRSGLPIRAKALLALSALAFLASGFQPSFAAKKEISVDSAKQSKIEEGFQRFASLPLSTKDLVVVAEDAKVKIVRIAGQNEISFYANCPRNWNVQGSTVRQAAFSLPRKGTAMLADALGNRAIANGKVYLFPAGPMRGLQMNTKGVFVNGEELKPLSGTEMPGTCNGKDALEVRVPDSYTGNIALGSAGSSELSLSSWKGGDLSCLLTGKSSFSASKLDGLNKAVLDNKGDGTVEVNSLSAKIFVANVSRSGQVIVNDGKTELSNATVSGNGGIKLNGTFKNLQKSVEGAGKLEINP